MRRGGAAEARQFLVVLSAGPKRGARDPIPSHPDAAPQLLIIVIIVATTHLHLCLPASLRPPRLWPLLAGRGLRGSHLPSARGRTCLAALRPAAREGAAWARLRLRHHTHPRIETRRDETRQDKTRDDACLRISACTDAQCEQTPRSGGGNDPSLPCAAHWTPTRWPGMLCSLRLKTFSPSAGPASASSTQRRLLGRSRTARTVRARSSCTYCASRRRPFCNHMHNDDDCVK